MFARLWSAKDLVRLAKLGFDCESRLRIDFLGALEHDLDGFGKTDELIDAGLVLFFQQAEVAHCREQLLFELAAIVFRIRNAERFNLEGEVGRLPLEGFRFAIGDGEAFGKRPYGRAKQEDLFLQRLDGFFLFARQDRAR